MISSKVVLVPLVFLILISVSRSPRIDPLSSLFEPCGLPHNQPSLPEQPDIIFNVWRTPFLGDGFIAFREAIAFKESRGEYQCVNKFGYLGKYQFSPNTLKLLGIYSTHTFLNQPELQEKAFLANAIRNKWVLRNYLKRFENSRINGIHITQSGMIAAAHLAGPANVKRYLNSGGNWDTKDALGTKLSYYLKKFSSYDTYNLPSEQKPKAYQL